MGIQATTARDAELARKREAFLSEHKLRDYKLSGRHLMKMVLASGASKAAADAVRERFTYSYGCSLKWSGPTWDHLEMLGRDKQMLVLVSHPYSIDDEGRRDISLFKAAGLRVVVGDKAESWYGYGTYHVRVEHPAFSGEVVRPASPRRLPVESAYAARLHRAAPALLGLARERAADLSASIAMIPCTGPGGVTPCLSCELRVDLGRITALIREVEGP